MHQLRIVLLTSLALAGGLALAGCAPMQPAQIEDERLTVGTVQGEIKIGLDAASVAAATTCS